MIKWWFDIEGANRGSFCNKFCLDEAKFKRFVRI